MKMRNLLILFLLLAIGCSGKTSGPAGSNPGEASKSAAPATAESPSQVAKNFLEAVRGRRYAEVREMLSERSITNMSEAAGRANTNLDQSLKRIIDDDAANMTANNHTSFETRNEEIRGQNATVEAKATNAPQFARLSLTKEGERWKINIDETAPAN